MNTLADDMERLGVRVGKHPTGALTLQAYGSRRIVLPQPNGYMVQEPQTYGGARVVSAYPAEDIDKLRDDLADWARKHPFKH